MMDPEKTAKVRELLLAAPASIEELAIATGRSMNGVRASMWRLKKHGSVDFDSWAPKRDGAHGPNAARYHWVKDPP